MSRLYIVGIGPKSRSYPIGQVTRNQPLMFRWILLSPSFGLESWLADNWTSFLIWFLKSHGCSHLASSCLSKPLSSLLHSTNISMLWDYNPRVVSPRWMYPIPSCLHLFAVAFAISPLVYFSLTITLVCLRGNPSHWGQGVTYPAGKWWVFVGFVLNLLNHYPPGKWWANFEFAQHFVHTLPSGLLARQTIKYGVIDKRVTKFQ